MRIRPAEEKDLPAILEIFNHALLTSTSTYHYYESTLKEREEWLSQLRSKGYPVLVAEDEARTVLGYASLSAFRPQTGYLFTTEFSIYVKTNAQRTGVGSALLREIIQEARKSNFKVLIGCVDNENLASERLHRKFGFQKVAVLPKTGFKFGKYLDLACYLLEL